MSDLVALQLVDRVAEDSYRLSSLVKSTSPTDIAEHIHAQLARHVVCKELSLLDRDAIVNSSILDLLVEKTRPVTTPSAIVIHQYAMNLKRWLLFSGHLEERGSFLYRPMGKGAQMGILRGRANRGIKFLGNSSPQAVLQLLHKLEKAGKSGIADKDLLQLGVRNAIYDATALQFVNRSEGKRVILSRNLRDPSEFESILRREVLRQPATLVVASALRDSPNISGNELGEIFRKEINPSWKESSSFRYANGLRRYIEWASKLS